MDIRKVTMRCYGEQKDGQWTVVCLDLCLAAQSSTLEKAQRKLHDQIKDYLKDALAGVDREHAAYLLRRKAPLSLWLKYYCIKAAYNFNMAREKTSALFTEIMPLRPC